MDKDNKFSGDRPIKEISQDKLGFDYPAEKVAKAILKFANPEGFVIGLEGEWGTGKSSFINLISKHLKAAKPAESAPEIVHFSPWLISSRDGLLAELFQEIGVAADNILDSEKANLPMGGFNEADRSSLKSELSKYSGHLIMAGKLTKLAGDLGVPFAGLAGSAFQQAGAVVQDFATEMPLEKRKEKIKTELRSLKRQIVVFVDDIDRLEPKEAGEVVRLVRAVADFPNIVYVLSYSRSILKHSLAKAFSLDSDNNYIDKVVQVTFSVPKPEDFALRRMFRDGLMEIFPSLNTQASTVDYNSPVKRLTAVIDTQGGKTLQVPRDVSRSLNSIRLYAGAVESEIDFADMVWLQLIRLRNLKLYNWIELYMNAVGGIVNENGQIGIEIKRKSCQNFLKIIQDEEGYENIDRILYDFGEVIPGIEKAFSRDEDNQNTRDWSIYENLNESHLSSFIEQRRLGSPSHYRYYFALTKPSSALSDDEFKSFLELLENDELESKRVFRSLCERKLDSGQLAISNYIYRLKPIVSARLTQKQIRVVILCLADSMDVAALASGYDGWSTFSTWEDVTSLFRGLLNALDEQRENTLKKIYGTGRAIGWLAKDIRSEIFDQGIYGNNSTHSENWLFSKAEFEIVFSNYIKNVKAASPKKIQSVPGAVHIIYAWLQGRSNGKNELIEYYRDYLKTDEGFLNFVSLFLSRVTSNVETYYSLNEKNIPSLLEYEEVKRRIISIAANNKHPQQKGAIELEKAVNRSRPHFQ